MTAYGSHGSAATVTPPLRPRRRLRPAPLVVAGLAVLLVGAIAVGAYGNWRLWHPADGFVVALAALAALLTGGLVAAAGRGAVRSAALVPLVVGVGLLVGYAFGPDRPELRQDPGRIDVALDALALERVVTGTSCATADQGYELQVAASTRLAVLPADPSIPADVDDRAFVGFHITVGDRWRDGRVHRSDNVDLAVIVSGVRDGTPERRLAASDSSTVEIAWDNERGTLAFAALVDAETGGPVAGPLGTLAGTISWVCGKAALPPGAAEFAGAACANARYPGCVSDLIAAIAAAPGTEVAICEAGEDLGEVVPAADVEVHEACTGDGETFSGRVLRVVRLPR